MSEPTPPEWEVRTDLALKDYHAIFGISGSGITRALRSLAHWRAGADAPTRAMALGSALHTMILEPGKFDAQFRVFTERGPKNRLPTKGLWEAFKADAEAAGAEILDADEMDALRGMQAAILQHAEARRLIEESEVKEASLIWRPPHLGLALKTRPDMIHGGGVVLDLKKTSDASPHAFRRAAVDYGYFHQAAWNRWMLGKAAEAGVIRLDPAALRFIILAVEDAEPHGVVLYEIPAPTLDALVSDLLEVVQRIASAHQSGKWDAYPNTIQTLDLPDWAKNKQ